MKNIFAILAVMTVSLPVFAAEPERQVLMLGDGRIQYSSVQHIADADESNRRAVVVASCQMGKILFGGCSVRGPFLEQKENVIRYAASDANLVSSYPSYDSFKGTDTWICHYSNLEDGETVTAIATCE